MSSGRPRVLVVAYDFPPHAAIGTMRTLRVVRRLAAEGWDVTVLTGHPRTYRPGTPVDEALIQQVPAGVRIVRAPAVRAFEQMKRLATGRRRPASDASRPAQPVSVAVDSCEAPKRNVVKRAVDLIDAALAIPDNESAWLLPAIAAGVAAATTHAPDVLYSSAPPWTGQLVARALAATIRVPWVADFRDPWSRAPWRGDRFPFTMRASAMFERRVIRRADHVLFVAKGNRDDFARYYGPNTTAKFHLVPNGCEPAEFDRIERPVAGDTDLFTLLHAGSLYAGRTPTPLLKALASGARRELFDRRRVRLQLLGTVGLANDLRLECRALGVEDMVEFLPRVPRDQSIRAMTSASALLLLQQGHMVSVPGKVYEYLAAGRPILAIAEDESETAALVRDSGIGISVPPYDEEQVLDALVATIDRAAHPVEPPPRALWDGTIGAAQVARILTAVVRGDRVAAELGIEVQP